MANEKKWANGTLIRMNKTTTATLNTRKKSAHTHIAQKSNASDLSKAHAQWPMQYA